MTVTDHNAVMARRVPRVVTEPNVAAHPVVAVHLVVVVNPVVAAHPAAVAQLLPNSLLRNSMTRRTFQPWEVANRTLNAALNQPRPRR